MSNNFFTLQSPDREGGGTSIENRILKHMRQIQSFLFQTRQKEVQIINFFMQNKANLKNAQMNVTAYNTKDYGNFRPFSRRKNKANQSQFKPNSGPILALFSTKLALFFTPNFTFPRPIRLFRLRSKQVNSGRAACRSEQKRLKRRILGLKRALARLLRGKVSLHRGIAALHCGVVRL